MNRSLLAAVAVLAFSVNSANAQSWIFQPGTYSRTSGPAALQNAAPVQSATGSQSVAGSLSSLGSQTANGPKAYASFTESQAAAAATMPKPAFQWDPTGILGRGQRYEQWSHEEAMEANRLETYARGVRDAVGMPVWTWNPTAYQPLPRITAPKEDLAN